MASPRGFRDDSDEDIFTFKPAANAAAPAFEDSSSDDDEPAKKRGPGRPRKGSASPKPRRGSGAAAELQGTLPPAPAPAGGAGGGGRAGGAGAAVVHTLSDSDDDDLALGPAGGGRAVGGGGRGSRGAGPPAAAPQNPALQAMLDSIRRGGEDMAREPEPEDEPTPPPPPPPGRAVTLKVRCGQGGHEVGVLTSDPFSLLFARFEAHARAEGWAEADTGFKYVFDGQLLSPDALVGSEDLEDGDYVDVQLVAGAGPPPPSKIVVRLRCSDGEKKFRLNSTDAFSKVTKAFEKEAVKEGWVGEGTRGRYSLGGSPLDGTSSLKETGITCDSVVDVRW